MPQPKTPKSIQVFPRDAKTDETINALAEKLRTSRAGLAALALDFAVEHLRRGTAHVVNGALKLDEAQAA